MNKRPEVGDTVVVRGVVLSVAPTFCYIRTDDESSQLGISFERISEIIPKPWEPKVGDQIRYNVGDQIRYNTGAFIYTIQAIIQDRIWVAWVASNGIRSDSIIHDFKKENYTLCVD